MIRPLFLIAALPLAACDMAARDPANGNGVNINAAADGKVSFDLPFAKGQVKLPASMMENGNVDIDGVKLPEGSKMTGFSVMAGDGKEPDVNLSFSAPQAPAEVRSHFVSQFAKNGAEAGMSGDTVAATTREGAEVAITISPEGTGSKGMIAIKPKA